MPAAEIPSCRFVIINADDFGYSAEVNAAVKRTHLDGALTSASLMVAEPGFSEAVELAKEMPKLGVGLHLVVTHDRSLLPRSALPDLIDSNGKFGADPFKTGVKYALSKRAQGQLRLEIEAQFARFAETGLEWSHADGHQHFHLPPSVWDIFLDQCLRHGVTRLRYPREEIRAHLKTEKAKPDLDAVASILFRLLRRRNMRRLLQRSAEAGHRFFIPDRVYGHLQTGRMSADYSLRLLERLRGSVNEIYYHPGAPHSRLLPEHLRSEGVEDVETAALLNADLNARLNQPDRIAGNYSQAEMWNLSRAIS